MKKLLMATAATALMAGAASADEIKIGIILGFTGPLESITPAMALGAELAMAEVTASGKLNPENEAKPPVEKARK
ncbi:MAG: branched-chain amino acid ABC transporter substrate-binding protein, partial [Paracoccaceae bacterium]|nr:branched-chain amino acid ABC transporter substrate-binding protein [Paracoccaceae bacterium]